MFNLVFFNFNSLLSKSLSQLFRLSFQRFLTIFVYIFIVLLLRLLFISDILPWLVQILWQREFILLDDLFWLLWGEFLLNFLQFFVLWSLNLLFLLLIIFKRVKRPSIIIFKVCFRFLTSHFLVESLFFGAWNFIMLTQAVKDVRSHEDRLHPHVEIYAHLMVIISSVILNCVGIQSHQRLKKVVRGVLFKVIDLSLYLQNFVEELFGQLKVSQIKDGFLGLLLIPRHY